MARQIITEANLKKNGSFISYPLGAKAENVIITDKKGRVVETLDKKLETLDSTSYSIENIASENLVNLSPGEKISEALRKLYKVTSRFINHLKNNTSGENHIPTGGRSGYVLTWDSDGKAKWAESSASQSEFQGATASVAGAKGLVPAPAAGKQTSFLRGDGVWAENTYTKGTGININNNIISLAESVTAQTEVGGKINTTGSEIKIPYFSFDKYGRMTASGTRTHSVNFKTSLTLIDDGNVAHKVIQLLNPDPNSKEPITVGSELIIGAGGNVFIGGGEASVSLRNALKNTTSNDEGYVANGERTYVSADADLCLYSDCNAVDNRKGLSFKGGALFPLIKNQKIDLGTTTNPFNKAYVNNAICMFGENTDAYVQLSGVDVTGKRTVNFPDMSGTAILGNKKTFSTTSKSISLDINKTYIMSFVTGNNMYYHVILYKTSASTFGKMDIASAGGGMKCSISGTTVTFSSDSASRNNYISYLCF